MRLNLFDLCSPEELDRYVSKCNDAEGSNTAAASESQKQQVSIFLSFLH